MISVRADKFIFCLFWISLLILSGCGQTKKTNRENSNKSLSQEVKQNMNGKTQTPIADLKTAHKELESYVVDVRYGRKTVPTNLDPAHVESFLRQRIDRARQAPSFARARRVVDVYDLTRVLDHFEKFLDRREKDTKEFNQSLQAVRTLAETGDAAQKNKARDYYDYLVKNPLSVTEFEQLTDAIDSFGAEFISQPLQQTMAAEFQKLKSRGAKDREADDEAEIIDGLLNNELPRALADLNLRTSALGVPQPQERIEQLVRIYLGWSESGSAEIVWWGARQLRREFREGRAEAIFSAFRKVTDEIEKSNLDDEEKFAYLLRSARAVRFFGGTLSKKEQNALNKPDAGQIDVLDNH